MPARHKGILSDSMLDRLWPHHAVVPWENCCGDRYQPAHGWAHERGCAARMVRIERYGGSFIAFRFKEQEHAEEMCQLFGGETYTATERGKGTGWEKWRKKQRKQVR